MQTTAPSEIATVAAALRDEGYGPELTDAELAQSLETFGYPSTNDAIAAVRAALVGA